MTKIWEYVLRNWHVIREAPLAFFGLLSLLGIGIWWVSSWYYGGRLDVKDDTIQSQDGTIQSQREWLDEYRQKLNVDTPDEAAKKIKSLEDQIAELTAHKSKQVLGELGTEEYFKNWMNQPKVVVRDKKFGNEIVTLDGFSFINCTFRNVKFLFNGTAPFDLERNQIYNPIIHIKRPEFYTLLQLLKVFGHLPEDLKIMMNGKVTDL